MKPDLSDPAWLAAALASYEADEPHDADETDSYYPPIDVEEQRRSSEEPHSDECVSLGAGPCPRCQAESARHKAEWLLSQANGVE